MNFNERINFVTRRTRKALNILTDLKALNAELEPPKIISTKESATINASKQFILSRKYPIIPKASILKNISTALKYII